MLAMKIFEILFKDHMSKERLQVAETVWTWNPTWISKSFTREESQMKILTFCVLIHLNLMTFFCIFS